MFSKFQNIEQEKQDRILNAAMKIFAQKGFEHASTNDIVKEASISKGLLFHYFKNKRQLFLFVYDHCLDQMMNEFFLVAFDELDLFDRLREVGMKKLKLMAKYPDIFLFFEVIHTEDSTLKSDIEKRSRVLQEHGMNKLFEGIDTTKFKDGLEMRKILKVIFWTFDGFSRSLLTKLNAENKRLTSNEVELEKMMLEADVYIKILKTCFYK